MRYYWQKKAYYVNGIMDVWLKSRTWWCHFSYFHYQQPFTLWKRKHVHIQYHLCVCVHTHIHTYGYQNLTTKERTNLTRLYPLLSLTLFNFCYVRFNLYLAFSLKALPLLACSIPCYEWSLCTCPSRILMQALFILVGNLSILFFFTNVTILFSPI